MALKGPEKGPCCLLALRPSDHNALLSSQTFLLQSLSHSPCIWGSLTVALCSCRMRSCSVSIFGCSEKDSQSQPCPLWAGWGSLFLQKPAKFTFLFVFPHLPSLFGNFRQAARPNFTHSVSTKTLFCPGKRSNLSLYPKFFSPVM